MKAARLAGVVLQALVLGTLLFVALWQLARLHVDPGDGFKGAEHEDPAHARIFEYQGY